MKRYFDFTLKGEALFSIWLIFIVAFMLPYIFLIYDLSGMQPGDRVPVYPFLLVPVMMVLVLGLYYYLARIFIVNTVFDGVNLRFEGKLWEFMKINLIGMLLSIVTLGIYLPWFLRDIMRYFARETYLNDKPFKFLGDGGTLLLILIFGFLIPYFIIISLVFIMSPELEDFSKAGNAPAAQAILMVILIPYYYLTYKWFVNYRYKDLNIEWHTLFWNSCGKIALELFLTMITVGIYFPLAMLKLYKYFAERTVAEGSGRELHFGYEIEPKRDFLLLWGQLLLTIFTIGIYYPWAISVVGKRILSKTYLHEEVQAGASSVSGDPEE